MGVRITSDEDKAALFDSVSGWAFGPVFDNSDEADDFLTYCESAELPDLRTMSEPDLMNAHEKWAADRLQQSEGATPGAER